jgi:hypothetical protein
MHRTLDRFIVAGVAGSGFYWEEAGRTHVGRMSVQSLLGSLASREFERCHPGIWTEELRTRKPSTWPAFQASKCRSMTQFEREFVQYSIRALNDNNVTVQIESEEIRDKVRLSAVSNIRMTGDVGFRLRRMHKLFVAWENA